MPNLKEEIASIKRLASKVFVGGGDDVDLSRYGSSPARFDLSYGHYIPLDYGQVEREIQQRIEGARWRVDHSAIYIYCDCGYTFVRRRDDYPTLNHAAQMKIPSHHHFYRGGKCSEIGKPLKHLPEEIHCHGCDLLVQARYNNHGQVVPVKHSGRGGTRCPGYNRSSAHQYYISEEDSQRFSLVSQEIEKLKSVFSAGVELEEKYYVPVASNLPTKSRNLGAWGLEGEDEDDS